MASVWPGKGRIIHWRQAVRIVLLHTGVGVGGVLMQHALVDRHWSIECTTQGSVHKCIHKRNLFPLHVRASYEKLSGMWPLNCLETPSLSIS